MNTSFNKYSSSLPKLYQYSNWELPANNVVLSHSLLVLSGYKEPIEEKQSTISHLVGLSRVEANYVLLDETFYQLLINEHYKLCEYYSLENIKKREEEEKIREENFEKAKELNDYKIIENMTYENIFRESKHIQIEQDKNKCEQRNLELNNNLKNVFPNLNELKHGDIIQFRNERLQFSFYVYKAQKGTFEQLLNKFKQYIQKIIEQNGIINENDRSINNFKIFSNNKYELILIPSLGSDGYGIPSLFNDAPLYYFKHLSPGLMYRWIYLQLINKLMPIYNIIQKDIELKKQFPTYRTLVDEGGYDEDILINELEDGEEKIIEDLNIFPDAYVFIYDEVRTKLNIDWRKIDSNDYCNQYSSMYLLTKWTQQLQYEN
ncbi:unnamed protein product [Rotaria sp. Silwood1]|nr:unnamed protein product [Rotaria sp. Silwood1]